MIHLVAKLGFWTTKIAFDIVELIVGIVIF